MRRLLDLVMLTAASSLFACGDNDVVSDAASTFAPLDAASDAELQPTTDPVQAELDASGADAILAADAEVDARVEMDSAVLLDAGQLDASANLDAASNSQVDAVAQADAAMADAAVNEDAAPVQVGPPKPAEGQLVITEIQFWPVGYGDDLDALAEWVEVYNPSEEQTYSLSGCTFSDRVGDADFLIPAGVEIGPKSYFVFMSAPFTQEMNGFVGNLFYDTSEATGLSSKGDSPTVKCDGVVVDTVNYGLGFPLPAESEGHTLQLAPSKLDAVANNDASNWCYATAAYHTRTLNAVSYRNYGTPKAGNEACP